MRRTVTVMKVLEMVFNVLLIFTPLSEEASALLSYTCKCLSGGLPKLSTMGLQFYGRRALVTDLKENKMIIKFRRVAVIKFYSHLEQACPPETGH